MTKQEKAVLHDIVIDLRKSIDLDELEIKKEVKTQINRLYDLIDYSK